MQWLPLLLMGGKGRVRLQQSLWEKGGSGGGFLSVRRVGNCGAEISK